MDVELLPHVGVAAFRLGMPFDDAMAEARTWGRVEHSPEGGRPPGKYVVVNETYQSSSYSSSKRKTRKS